MAKGKRQMKLSTVIKRAQKLNDSGDYISAIKEVGKQLGYGLHEAKRMVDWIKGDRIAAGAEAWCPDHREPFAQCMTSGKHDESPVAWEIVLMEPVMEDIEPAPEVHIVHNCKCGARACSDPWHAAAMWINDMNSYKKFLEFISGECGSGGIKA